MNKPKEKPRGITFAVWKNAPLSWSLYLVGLRLNRTGWVAERIGGRVMAYAIERMVNRVSA